MKRLRRTAFALSMMASSSGAQSATGPDDRQAKGESSELAKLKAQLEEQQKQIEQLRADRGAEEGAGRGDRR